MRRTSLSLLQMSPQSRCTKQMTLKVVSPILSKNIIGHFREIISHKRSAACLTWGQVENLQALLVTCCPCRPRHTCRNCCEPTGSPNHSKGFQPIRGRSSGVLHQLHAMVRLTFQNVAWDLLGITDTTFQCTNLTYSLYDCCRATIFWHIHDGFISPLTPADLFLKGPGRQPE